MAEIEVPLPEDTCVGLERLVDEEFANREQAVEELLSAGLDAHEATADAEEPPSGFAEEAKENLWDTADTRTPE